mmetsp:Transcript_54105/g.166474  ORF Transcript_54105/g.166474 Transcript_54105/m.166474 type:complete len:240 (-) Transcript_54105:1074-1793(-)
MGVQAHHDPLLLRRPRPAQLLQPARRAARHRRRGALHPSVPRLAVRPRRGEARRPAHGAVDRPAHDADRLRALPQGHRREALHRHRGLRRHGPARPVRPHVQRREAAADAARRRRVDVAAGAHRRRDHAGDQGGVPRPRARPARLLRETRARDGDGFRPRDLGHRGAHRVLHAALRPGALLLPPRHAPVAFLARRLLREAKLLGRLRVARRERPLPRAPAARLALALHHVPRPRGADDG